MLANPLAASASTIAGQGTLTVDGEEPDYRFAWVPADRAEILDDWNPTGLRGTGSNSIVIPKQTIPLAWTVSTFDPTENDRGPYRTMVGNGNWPIACSVAAVQLGASRRALDEAQLALVHKIEPRWPTESLLPATASHSDVSTPAFGSVRHRANQKSSERATNFCGRSPVTGPVRGSVSVSPSLASTTPSSPPASASGRTTSCPGGVRVSRCGERRRGNRPRGGLRRRGRPVRRGC